VKNALALALVTAVSCILSGALAAGLGVLGFVSTGLAVPFALHLSLLLAASYAARHRMSRAMASPVLLVLTLGFAVLLETLSVRALPLSAQILARQNPAGEGLKLIAGDETLVLLAADGQPAPRVRAAPGSPLAFVPAGALPDGARPSPSREPETPFAGLAADLAACGAEFDARFAAGLRDFLVYAGSLFLLLLSLCLTLGLSAWPLVSLFAGAFLFRLALAFEALVNAPPVQGYLAAFCGPAVPRAFLTPAVYTAVSVLLIVFGLLAALARRAREQPAAA